MAISFSTVLSTIVVVLAAVVGLFLSSVPAQLGFYRYLTNFYPGGIGMTPAFLNGIPWKYTFKELYVDGEHTLKGQNAIVTGANSGVGYATSMALGRLGASVTLACRNTRKCERAAQAIRDDSRYGDGGISAMNVDTSSLQSVQTFSREYMRKNAQQTLDMLYLNAGMIVTGQHSQEDVWLPLSEDGIEMTFATNYVGHHLMHKLLEPLIVKSKMARIVLTSSEASFRPNLPHKVATSLEVLNSASLQPDGLLLYGQSKLAQILWAKELTRKLGPNSNVYVNAVHPGAVDTEIWGKNPGIPDFITNTLIKWLRNKVFWTAEEGALTMLYLGVATDDLVKKNIRGKYFHPQAEEVVNALAIDEPLQKELWKFSDELVSKFAGRIA